MKAEAEKEASELKGASNARFREQVAEGLANAGKTLQSGDAPPGVMLFTMWLDGM